MLCKLLDKEMLPMAEVQKAHEDKELSRPNVVGIGLGHRFKDGVETAEPVITALVEQKVAPELLSPDELVPKELDGVPTDVVQVGPIFAGETGKHFPVNETETTGENEKNDIRLETGYPAALTGRVRPVPGGYSIGHYQVTCGTLGVCVRDREPLTGKYYILSNNHVLANLNNAHAGDPILQPGRCDGGKAPRDVIAKLARFVSIRFTNGENSPVNYVDAAIAEGNIRDLKREIHWLGYAGQARNSLKMGDIVQKTGRTTGFTTGKIAHLNATVIVNYSAGQQAKFCHQIVTNLMNDGGDSGSLVTDSEGGAVGLMFASSSTHSFINDISHVERLLGICIS